MGKWLSHVLLTVCKSSYKSILPMLYRYPILEAGLREVYFGELLGREAESSNMFTTYVSHFCLLASMCIDTVALTIYS